MTTVLDELLKDPEYARVYAEESLVTDVMEAISEWMEVRGVHRAELARRLGTSRAHVTQMLNGRNISLRTLARVVHALDGQVEFSIRPRRTRSSARPTLSLLPRDSAAPEQWWNPDNVYEFPRSHGRSPARAASGGTR